MIDYSLRPLFIYPGGSYYIYHRLKHFIPPHRIYVEPFCGSAAFFFVKPKTEVNVLNDINKRVVWLLKEVQKGLSCEAIPIKQFDEIADKYNSGNYSPCDFLYINAFMFNGSGGIPRTSKIGKPYKAYLNKLEILDMYREKLQGVKILSQDYKRVVANYDSQETFFYFDPPWELEFAKRFYSQKDKFNLTEFVDVLNSIVGQFFAVFNYSDEVLSYFKKYLNRNIGIGSFATKYAGNNIKGGKSSVKRLLLYRVYQ